MNEQERAELEQLKEQQARLRDQLANLARKLDAFETNLSRPEPKATSDSPKSPSREIVPPQIVPEQITVEITVPPPIPPIIPPVMGPKSVPVSAQTDAKTVATKAAQVVASGTVESAASSTGAEKVEEPPIRPRPLPGFLTGQTADATVFPPVPPSEPGKKSSFEMRLGTYWLVRIGIVMLLTGLVFFGAYAYENFIGRLGPGGKVVLLYLASGVLLGTGAWLQRKEEAIRNYAQVLVAGGLAAVYFTTYAAHYAGRLQVITSPLLDGALLLGWAGFIIWLADKKKSEVLALFAVLLAYYTSIITHVGLFTLYSNLVLTVAAVFFLVRNRWATVSFASLAATYVSYGFWRFYQDGQWQLAGPDEGLWTGNFFLMGYWAVFTAAVFLSKHEQFRDVRRASFLSLNNGAFFCAFVLTMLQVHHGGFWKFSLAYGAILTALAFAARRFLATDKLAGNSYLTQGLLLVTLGFLTYYSGLKLSLVLAVESAALVILGRQLKSQVMQIASVVAATLAVGWGIQTLTITLAAFDHNGLIMGAAVGALMVFNAFWLQREAGAEAGAFRVRIICFTVLGLGMWVVTTWQNTADEWRGFALACEAASFLLAGQPLKNQFLKIGAYVFAGMAAGWEIGMLGDQYSLHKLPERVGLMQGSCIGALMIFCALWERRISAAKQKKMFEPPVTFYCVLSLLTWLATTCVFTPREHLAPVLAGEALLFTVSYYLLRLVEMTLFGQFFLVLAQAFWLIEAVGNHVSRPWWNPALVIAITLGLAQWWQRQKTLVLERTNKLSLQGIYALAVVGLVYFWLEPQFAAPHWLALTSALAIILTIYGTLNRYWLLVAAGQIFLLVSGWQFGAQLWDGKPDWYLALAPIITLGLLSYFTIKWFERRPGADVGIRSAIFEIALIYRVAGLVMSLWWVHKYIPAREICWVLGLVGLVLFMIAGWRRNQELLMFSAVYTLVGLGRFCMPWEGAPTVYWPNLLAILLLLAQQRAAKHLPDNYRLRPEIYGGAIILGAMGLWLYLSRWILQTSDGFYLTAGWSVLALILFGAGMAVRERVYRWAGLAVLACALGRVVIFDVWKLEIIYRVLSFMALGIVLLVLGFVYNKYQEKIREWL
jgi:uncharacterized membrane protein